MTEARYRFLATRRWAGLAALAIVAAVACVFLGRWQLDRHHERAAANQVVIDNYDATPVPLEDLLGQDLAVEPDQVWHRVTFSGRFVGDQVLLRNRPVDGRPALRVLVPFEVDSGGDERFTVIVDRGWVDAGTDPAAVPGYPSGEVSVVGRVRLAEEPGSRTPPAGQVYEIDPATVLASATGSSTGLDGVSAEPALVDGYVLAFEEAPPATTALPQLPRPETDPGSHLSYAFQWWVFAFIGPVGFVVLARREAADRDEETPAPAIGTADDEPSAATAAGPAYAGGTRRSPRPRRRPSDAEEEDALIDAQLGGTPPPRRP